MSFFVTEARAEAPAPSAGATGMQDPLMGLLFPIGLLVVLYFFMIRPQVKRQKEHKKMVESLKKGDEVQTVGGLMGRITELGDNFASVEIAANVEVKVRRAAIEAVMPKGTLKEL